MQSDSVSLPGFHDRTVTVVAAELAHMVGKLDFAAMGAFDRADNARALVRPALTAPGTGHFLLGNCHDLRPRRIWRPPTSIIAFHRENNRSIILLEGLQDGEG